MEPKKIFLLYLLVFSVYSCSVKRNIINTSEREIIILEKNESKGNEISSIPDVKISDNQHNVKINISDTTFVNLKDFGNDFVYDMKYATEDNFLKSKVYDCEACYLRYKTVKALLKVNERFLKKGYRIKLFDCYRPLDIQKKMWTIVSNPNYVADPKKGSIHNRGGAVDITLVDSQGKELDMGTTFDYFGIEASHDFENLPAEVLKQKVIKKYNDSK